MWPSRKRAAAYASTRHNARVRHARHYTLAAARAELPWLARQLAAMRRARAALTDAEARQALAEAAPTNGGGRRGRQVGEAFAELQLAVAALERREIVVRDLDRGLVDFPALRDEREVYLCWVEGEPDIGFWHDLDAGFAGREPL
jgi:hypothetical protein